MARERKKFLKFFSLWRQGRFLKFFFVCCCGETTPLSTFEMETEHTKRFFPSLDVTKTDRMEDIFEARDANRRKKIRKIIERGQIHLEP